MKHLVQMVLVAALLSTILGCANKNGPVNPVNVNEVQAAGAANDMSYMYRSPPPAATARLIALPR